MFVDEITLTLKAGNGGNGSISWRHEKYIPYGGPFGGNGGHGGSIVLVADENFSTLSDYRYLKEIRAEEGEKGATKTMHGKNSEDTIVKVPVGTIVWNEETGEKIIDLDRHTQSHLLCLGGRGGKGNANFASSTRRAPNFAELGDLGEVKKVRLELKLVADIAIIGMPNAGKSTLISTLTNVRPKIADYPFTTLVPNLGVMDHAGRSIVIEDVPGLIEGASEGKGLGHAFLKHIERARTIVHLIAIDDLEVMVENYRMVRAELEKFSQVLAEKAEMIVISKSDLADEDHGQEISRELSKKLSKEVRVISSLSRSGIDTLRQEFLDLVPVEISDANEETTRVHHDLRQQELSDHWKLSEDENGDYSITGARIEQIVRMTDSTNVDAVDRVYDILEKMRIAHAIVRAHEKRNEWEAIHKSFFVGSEDKKMPRLRIAGKAFRIENILMRAMDKGNN